MKVRFNRKAGYCFLHQNPTHPIKVQGLCIRTQNSNQLYNVEDYFRAISSYNTADLKTLMDIARQLKEMNVVFKVIGSGIYAQLRMFLGALSKMLLNLLYNGNLSDENKQKIQDQFAMLQKYAKGDNRIVERKKPGRKGARAVGPTNKR
jgi:ribosomal protein S9